MIHFLRIITFFLRDTNMYIVLKNAIKIIVSSVLNVHGINSIQILTRVEGNID